MIKYSILQQNTYHYTVLPTQIITVSGTLMNHRMRDQLLTMLEDIVVMTGCPREVKNQDSLTDPTIYLDICHIIFPQLNIQLFRIRQTNTDPTARLLALVDLLTQSLQLQSTQVQLLSTSAFSTNHISALLHLLYEYSKMYSDNLLAKKRVTTDPVRSSSASARNYSQKCNKNVSDSSLSSRKQTTQSIPTRRPHKHTFNRKEVNAKQIHANIPTAVLQTMQKYKKASLLRKQTKKTVDGEMRQMHYKYKCYLSRYRKNNIAKINREGYLAERTQPRSKSQNILPRSDLQRIQGLYDSFAYKMRDRKTAYLRRIERIISMKENQRKQDISRIARQNKSIAQQAIKKEIQRENHTHLVKTTLIKEKITALDQDIAKYKQSSRKQNKSNIMKMKQNAQEQMRKIENKVRQRNEKKIMEMEEGSKLQRAIIMYYKYL